MTMHIYCSQEKRQRQKSDNASSSIPAVVLRARRCVAHGLRRSRFHSTMGGNGKLDSISILHVT